jgi:hypothetical protein
MARAEQRKVLNIDAGLFLLCYTSAEDRARPPNVRISMGRGQNPDIFLALQPDQGSAVLPKPGTSFVVVAMKPGQLIIEVTPSRPDGSSAATVKVEPLKVISVPMATSKHTASGNGLQILGHLAGIGDVSARSDEWLAGPSAPSRIEGFSIEWPDKPDDLTIRYSVRAAKPQVITSQLMELGAFAGTRGCAMPIVGVILEISGPAASRYAISTEALFLGSPRLHATGKRAILAGPTGREPLVGLRLSIDRLNSTRQAATYSAGSSGRVRVFRNTAQPESCLST